MREILADIWNMNEGKNPFEKTVKESPFDSKLAKEMKTLTYY